MMAKRTVLLGMLICATCVAAFGQPAVVAPNVGGDIGLFTMSTADNPRAGQFTLGVYAWYQPQIAGPFFLSQSDATRYFDQYGGTVSLGLGLTNWWSVFVAGGGQVTRSGGGWAAGYVNSLGIVGPFEASEGQKIRLGTKFNYASEVDPDFRIAGWLAGHIPISNLDPGPVGGLGEHDRGRELAARRLGMGRRDFEVLVHRYGLLHDVGRRRMHPRRRDDEIRVANIVKFGVGATIPVGTPMLQIIIEALYNVYDGGDFPPNDYAQLNGGARFWFGRSGWAAFRGLGHEPVDALQRRHQPEPVRRHSRRDLRRLAAGAPAAGRRSGARAGRRGAAGPAPGSRGSGPAAAAAPGPRTTTDEILFDGTSARLTNIAKAVLDGVALRMKNDLNATAVVTGYTDNTGSEQTNLELGARRAQAAKDYLVTRHGIDPGRITTVVEGRRRAGLRQRDGRGQGEEPPGPDCGNTRLGNVIAETSRRASTKPPPPEGVF